MTDFLKTTFVLLALALFALGGCRKDLQITTDPNAVLRFSTDTLYFDTVFTTIGSSTRRFKIFNPQAQAVKVSSIQLSGGSNSLFRLNLNGTSTTQLNDVIIEGGDSIYLFAEVTIDPFNVNTPLVVEDSVIFTTNGNRQKVLLVAWGQDAHFYYPDKSLTIGQTTIQYSIINCNSTWTDDKPHVIYGYAVVDTDCQLLMQAGTKVHLHAGSVLWVYDGGTLKIAGALGNEVLIQGDRLEPAYEEEPGQWGQIWLSAGSKNNEIDYAIIKNGTIGLRVDTLGNSSNPTLRLTNTVIRNMSGIGILGQGTRLEADNVEIYNCGLYNVVCNIGGDYQFRHCTLANYWPFSGRSTPLLLLNNYYEDLTGTIQPRDLTRAYFGNCILWGSNINELAWDWKNSAQFNWQFENSIVKFKTSDWPSIDPNDPLRFTNVLLNVDPKFADPNEMNYQLDTLSPAKDYGLNSIGTLIPFDLKGESRMNDAGPDLGAYERVE